MPNKFQFTPDLETGNSIVDNEHRSLIAAANRLVDACSTGAGKDEVAKSLRFLLDYTQSHFAHEEELMLAADYSGYQEHRDFHENFKQRTIVVASEILQEEIGSAAVMKIVNQMNILVGHIKSGDKAMAIALRE